MNIRIPEQEKIIENIIMAYQKVAWINNGFWFAPSIMLAGRVKVESLDKLNYLKGN